MNKLGFSEDEAALISFGEFSDLYREYQHTFDYEMTMLASSVANMMMGGQANTYSSLKEKTEDEDGIICF